MADRGFDALKDHVERHRKSRNVRYVHIDSANPDSIDCLMDQKLEVAIDLMPVFFNGRFVIAAIKHGIHSVNACYAGLYCL